MQANAFIFLDRSFATDAGRLDTILDYFINIGYNYQVYLIECFACCIMMMQRAIFFWITIILNFIIFAFLFIIKKVYGKAEVIVFIFLSFCY